jgi:hypothetical protein
MASSENIQSSPLPKETPTETQSVTLPPLPRPSEKDATTFLRLSGFLDAILVVMVLLFAFLVASSPVINTDFFRHAAIGRLLSQGEYHFGVDPFVYTADDTYFVNHSWLFDLLLYKLYQLPSGDAVVVVFKAVVIAVLAVVMLCAGRRAGQRLWIPAACTALAILAASPRFYLQSTCLSYLFLSVTLWLLVTSDAGAKRLWLLPPLFALWVNCDSWFFLGPLTLALYLVGELIQQKIHQPAAPAPTLPSPNLGEGRVGAGAAGWCILVLGVAACLLNPHHVRALTLPQEFGLTAASDLLANDSQFFALFLSPLGKTYYQPALGLSVAGLAYWPLLLLGLSSFLFVYHRMPWSRLLVWLCFALMSLYNWRIIPFFAVVAGPITALNWLDFAAQRLAPAPRLTRAWRSGLLGGRLLTLLLGMALLIATVPGWLQRSQPTFHHISWSIQVDPSLQEMAETIHGWRKAGLLPDDPHWFNMSFDIANYLAWFAPGERAFLDQSLPDFRQAAEDYLAIRRGLAQEAEQDSTAEKTDWQQILRDRDVRFWIYDDRSVNTANRVSRAVLFTQPEQWVLRSLNGRFAIFARRDPQQPSSAPPLDVERSAFGPTAETAPPEGAEPAPPRDWLHTALEAWLSPDPPPSRDREALSLYEFRYQFVEKPRQIYQHSRAWQTALAAATIPGSLPGGLVPTSFLPLSWSYTYNELVPAGAARLTRQPRKSEELALQTWDNYVNSQFFESPSLFLAVRAARRALSSNPEDGATYFRLGQTYQLLRGLPQENLLRNYPPQMIPQLLVSLRRTQITAAFQNCLRLQPDDDRAAQAHYALYVIFAQEFNYLDAAVHHLREAHAKQTAVGPPPGMPTTQYNQSLDKMSADLAKLENELGRRQDRYEVNAATKSGLEKAQAALELGLSETALAVLEQEADLNISSPTEILLVKVLTGVALDLGRPDRARELLPDPEGQPVKTEDLELYLRLAAARGDYAKADKLLDDALRHAWQPPPGQMRMPDPVMLVAPLVGKVLLAEAQHLMGTPSMPWATTNRADIFQRSWLTQNASEFWRRRWRMEAIINGLLAARQEAEWNLIRGWLALEAGHCVEARKHFQTALNLTVPGPRWAPEVNQLDAWLEPQSEIRGLQNVAVRHAVIYDQSTHYLNLLKE